MCGADPHASHHLTAHVKRGRRDANEAKNTEDHEENESSRDNSKDVRSQNHKAVRFLMSKSRLVYGRSFNPGYPDLF